MKHYFAIFSILFIFSACGDDEKLSSVTNCDFFPYTTESSTSLRFTTYNTFSGDSTVMTTENQSLFVGTKNMFDIDWLESTSQPAVNPQTGEMSEPLSSLSTCETGFVEAWVPGFTNESTVSGFNQIQTTEDFRLKLMPINNLTVGDTWEGGKTNTSSRVESPSAITTTESVNTYNYELVGLDESITVVGESYSDVAILNLTINIESTSTTIFDGESITTTQEFETFSKYFISRSKGNLRLDSYTEDFFNPNIMVLSSKQEYFDIKI